MRLFILLIAFECLLPACGKDDSKGDSTNAIDTPSTPSPTSDGKDGKDGANGAAGPKGEKGDKGDKGDTGSVGIAGVNGKDAEPLPVNQWYDSLTQRYWSILPAQPWTTNACGLYRFPTVAEMQEAINHGIFIASHTIGGENDNAWTGVADSGGHVAILPGITGADADSQSHGVFCVKK